MTTRAMGPGAGLRWLKQAVNLGSHNPKAVFGAAALFLMAALIPTILQLILQSGLGMTSEGLVNALGVFSLFYLLLVTPPLVMGFIRVIDATETGTATRASAIFDTFWRGDSLRGIGLFLLIIILVLAVFGILVVAYGIDFFRQIGEVLVALEAAEPGVIPVLPPLPDGFGTFLALVVVLGTFINGVYAIGFGQVALAGRSIIGALGDGIVGALKNALPLLVLLLISLVVGIVLLLLLALLITLLAFIGGLVHPALATALQVPISLGAMLVLYVIGYGVMYFMWRDVCGEAPPPVANDNQVEA